ncbi:apyrase 2-like [Pyrus ussuriensis x Pyrus communis]|uniref:Apyrase 2-like n=1 Tax=Pyrus ussuriensis x Pyrus communis TaxID=2448454 RepID=A0A5N5GRI2_9ROSA|nr:apyrase 2-like [Pyrus ussuriensis x Pyrus communis]
MRSKASPSKSIRLIVAAMRTRVKKLLGNWLSALSRRPVRDSTVEARLDLKKELEIFADACMGAGCSNYRRRRNDDDGERDARVFMLVNFEGAMMNMRSSPRFSIYNNGEGDGGKVWLQVGLEG